VKGSNSFVQRWKRWFFRVPRYVTGRELAAQVAAAKKSNGTTPSS